MAVTLDHANEVILALERGNKILREQLAILRQGLFGRKTEHIDPGQLGLFANGAPASDSQSTVEVARTEALSRKPSTPGPIGHGRAHFPEHLPRAMKSRLMSRKLTACAPIAASRCARLAKTSPSAAT